jgi:hypothetical protein
VEEVWRKLHNDELSDLYSAPGIIRMIKQGECDGSRGMRVGFLWKIQKERDH